MEEEFEDLDTGTTSFIKLQGGTTPSVKAEPVKEEVVQLVEDFEMSSKTLNDFYTYIKGEEGKNRGVPIVNGKVSENSGFTVGYGYDLKHRTPEQIDRDFHMYPEVRRNELKQLIGLSGVEAQKKGDELKKSEGFKSMLEGIFTRDEILKDSVVEHMHRARDNWNDARHQTKLGYSVPFSELSLGQRLGLLDIEYNGGIKKYPAMGRAAITNDKAAYFKESKRFSDGKELGRNKRFNKFFGELWEENNINADDVRFDKGKGTPTFKKESPVKPSKKPTTNS